MRSRTTRAFREMLLVLPQSARSQARNSYALFAVNPKHPGLRFKKVHPTMPIYSARVSSDYRAVGILEEGEIMWFWIGTHADYDKLLKGF